jgi:hypothetical protein
LISQCIAELEQEFGNFFPLHRWGKEIHFFPFFLVNFFLETLRK